MLQADLEKAQTDSLHWFGILFLIIRRSFSREHQFTQAQSSATNRTLTLGRIKMFAINLQDGWRPLLPQGHV